MRVKKVIGLTVLAVLLIAGTVFGMKIRSEYTGETYYLQLVNPAAATGKVLDDGRVVVYRYNEKAYNKNGRELEVEFFSYIDRPLRKDAYLSIEYNEINDVLGYNEVQANEIPEAAMKKIIANREEMGK